MKLEEGMYARYNGRIGKIKYICDCEQCKARGYLEPVIEYIHKEDEYVSCYYKNDLKASHNIMDLIEVGDYLNGFKVSKIERYDTNTIIKIGNSTFNVLEGEKIYTPSYDNNNGYEKIEKLKSIVTKEMFSSVEYRMETD